MASQQPRRVSATTTTMLAVTVGCVAAVTTTAVTAAPPSPSGGNICSQNRTIGAAVRNAINLTHPGLEPANTAALRGDLAEMCEAIAEYYRTSNTSATWWRLPPVSPGSTLAGGAVDQMVFHDIFTGFPSPSGPVKLNRNPDGGLPWTWYGPDNDDEFMNVLNRHSSFGDLLYAWNQTGNPVYPKSVRWGDGSKWRGRGLERGDSIFIAASHIHAALARCAFCGFRAAIVAVIHVLHG